MASRFRQIAFTPSVAAQQSSAYGRAQSPSWVAEADALGPDELDFLKTRDSFYMATISETGWPYVQHRGGAPGFVKVASPSKLAFADQPGNRQLISAGNLQTNNRACLIFVDYVSRRRLKIYAHIRLINRADLNQEEWPTLADSAAERYFLTNVEGWDWNCPKYITPRYTTTEIEEYVDTLRQENTRLLNRVRALESLVKQD